MKCVDLCCSTTLCEAVVFSWLWTCWPKTISCPTRIYPLGGKDSLVTLMAPFVVNSNQQQLHPKQTLTTTRNHYPRFWTLNSPPSSPPPPHPKSIKQVFCWCRIWEERPLRFLQLLVKNYPLKGYWSKAIDSNIKIVILLPLENPKTSLQKDFKLWWPWNLFALNLNLTGDCHCPPICSPQDGLPDSAENLQADADDGRSRQGTGGCGSLQCRVTGSANNSAGAPPGGSTSAGAALHSHPRVWVHVARRGHQAGPAHGRTGN